MPSRAIPYLKAIAHLLCLLPLLRLMYMYGDGSLAAKSDPVKFLTHTTGNCALWMLMIDLAITPVRRLHTSLAWLIRFRRMIGLYAFFYATLHLLTYVFLFSGYDMQAAVAGLRAGHLAEPWNQLKLIWPSILDDFSKKRFLWAGVVAWVIFLALAITSPQRVLRAMGGKNWQRLHYLIYVAGFIVLNHLWWQLKPTAKHTPWKSTLVFFALMLARLIYWLIKRWRNRRRAALQPAAA